MLVNFQIRKIEATLEYAIVDLKPPNLYTPKEANWRERKIIQAETLPHSLSDSTALRTLTRYLVR